MITILTTTEISLWVEQMIDSVDRLNELVRVHAGMNNVTPGDKIIRVNEQGMRASLDWFDNEPPYIFPNLALNENNLLALVFYKLGNEQQAFTYLSPQDALYDHLLRATQLRFGYEISKDDLSSDLITAHNKAIIAHYGNIQDRPGLNTLRQLYADALDNAPDKNTYSFTAKHYLNLLLDAKLNQDALMACNSFLESAETEPAKMALKMQWCDARVKNLKLPYEDAVLEDIQDKQLECIAYLERNAQSVNAALLCMDASDVANFRGDFPKAKDLVNAAIQVFKSEDLPEFLGQAGLKKAHLLYNWSKNGSPQYYKAAINAFQDAQKVFKRGSHPEYFAEIQHYLGMIYSEIPASAEEKPMWTAFSASAFKEALELYEKLSQPYEYAMVSHNYATALMDFPPAKLHNNYQKADGLFKEALKVRTAKTYPVERALSLLNWLELCWLMHNEDQQAEELRIQQMSEAVEEVLSLVSDENLREQAMSHNKRLEELKPMI